MSVPLDILIRSQAELSGMIQANALLDGLTERAKKFLGLDLGPKLAGFFTLKSIVDFTEKAIDAEAELGNLSQRIGDTVEDLSTLEFAARKNRLTIDDLRLGLQIFNRQLFEGADAFRQLAIETKNTDGTQKDTVRTLFEVSDAFAHYQDGVAKSALATELFGRDGARFIPFLNRGAQGLRELQQEARAAGDEISSNTSKAAAEFKLQLGEIEHLFEHIFIQLSQEILPLLIALTKELANATRESGAFEAVALTLADVFKQLATSVVVVTGTISGYAQLLGELSVAADSFSPFTAMQRQADAFSALLKGNFREAVKTYFGGLAQDVSKAGTEVQGAFRDFFAYAERISQLVDKINSPGFRSPAAQNAGASPETANLGAPKEVFIPPPTKEQLAEQKRILDEINKNYEHATLDRMHLIEYERQHEKEIIQGKIFDYNSYIRAIDQIDKTFNHAAALETVSDETKKATEAQEQYRASVETTNQLLQTGEITQTEAQQRNNSAAEQYRQALLKILVVLKAIQENNPDLKEVIEEVQKLNLEIASIPPAKDLSFGGGVIEFMRRGIIDLGNQAAIAGQILSASLGNAVNGVSAGISGLITGTQTWGQAMQQTKNAVISALVQIGVQMIAQFALSRTIGAAMTLFGVQQATTLAVSYAPASAAVNTATFGASSAVGLGVTLAAIAAIVAALSAFAEGGLVPGAPSSTDNRLAKVATGEYINKSAAVSYYGPGLFEAINNFQIPKGSLSDFRVPVRTSGSFSFAGGGLVQAIQPSSAEISVPAPEVHVVMVKNERELEEYLQSNSGKKIIVRTMAENKHQIGVVS